MPKYTFTDPNTNKTIDLEGDSPPSEQELEEIFSQVQQPQSERSTFQKINESFPRVRKGLQVGMEALSAPFEMAGEAMRMPVENDPYFRPPSIVQRMTGKRTALPPAEPFNQFNKTLRSGAAYLSGLPKGTDNALNVARQEYQRKPSALDVTSDLALGLGTSLVAPRIANAPIDATVQGAKSIFTGAKNAGTSFRNKAISSIFGPSEEAVAARFKNPEYIKNYKSSTQLAEELPSSLKEVSTQLSKESDLAYKTLNTSFDPNQGAIKKDAVSGLLDKLSVDLDIGGTTFGRSNEQAVNTLAKLKKSFQNLKGKYISEKDAADIIRAVDPDINWEDPNLSVSNEALTKFRGKLDSLLKNRNPRYRKAMLPVAEKTDLLSKSRKSFSLRHEPSEGWIPSDTTATKIEGLTQPKRILSNEVSERLKAVTGKDYAEEANRFRLGRQFEPGATRPNGSRRVAAGGILGAAVGKMFDSPVIGSLVGAGTGLMLDTQGGAIAARLIDTLAKNPNSLGRFAPVIDKYAPILKQAALRGTPALEALHSQIQNSDPEYAEAARRIIEIPVRQKSIFRKAS